jgi:hypothetical protein
MSAVPRGWSVNHADPTHFIVRCGCCGRIAIEELRGEAHSRADDHAMRCRPTGVTPVVKPDDLDDELAPGTGEQRVAAADGGLDVDSDMKGEEVVVRYESVSQRAGEQEIIGDIVAMVPAPDDADNTHDGFILRLGNQTRRRVHLTDELVECSHNSQPGWRKIGDLTSVAPAQRADTPPVLLTDGGER